jgi:hypothetical protein
VIHFQTINIRFFITRFGKRMKFPRMADVQKVFSHHLLFGALKLDVTGTGGERAQLSEKLFRATD